MRIQKLVVLALVFVSIFFGVSACAENAGTINAPLTEAQQAVVVKSNYLASLICKSVYPAPTDPLACLTKMSGELDRAFPDALRRAEGLGLLNVSATTPEALEQARLVARILGACEGGEFSRCVEMAYRIISGAFDPHTAYIDANEFADMKQSSTGSFSGIGAEIGGKKTKGDPMIIINPMEGSPAEKAGLLPGDIVLGISKDGTSSGMRPTESYETLSEAVKDIRGAKGTEVRLLIERKGVGRREIVIARGTIETQIVKSSLLNEGNKRYGVIHIREFDGQVCQKTASAFIKVLRDAGGKLDGLILSVERDPGGYLHEVHCTLDLFLDAKSFVLTRDRASIEPYSPCWKDLLGILRCQGGIGPYPGDITNGLPILLMIDGGSASASEIFAASMKLTGRAVIAGTPTFQKGSTQSIYPIGDDTAIKITGAEFLVGTVDNWVPVQCFGITPDIFFDRGFDPKDKDGRRVTDCALERSIASGGPMPNAPAHPAIQTANPALFAVGEAMLEAYKKHIALEDMRLKEKKELLEQMER